LAVRDLDLNGMTRSGISVEFRQSFPQSMGFHPDDRIVFRVEILLSIKGFDGNAILLDIVTLAFEVFFANIF
jgi:hypothetical protein